MKIRYGFFLLLPLIIASDLFAQSLWSWKNPTPQGNDLRCVIVKADTIGLAIGDAGMTFRRLGGVFQSPVYPVSSSLRGGCFYKDTMWVAGDGGVIYRSVDNGVTWTSQSYTATSKVNFKACYDLSKTNFWVAGDSGIILYSTNSGVTFTKQTNSSKRNINAIANGTRSSVYAVGDSGTILQAVNYGGFGYFAITTSKKFNFWGVALDTAEAFIVGDSSYILHRALIADTKLADTTLDNGANSFYDVAYANPYVIVVGANGVIRVSTDNGDRWAAKVSGATEKLYKISLAPDFNTSGIAWVVGESGVFLRTADYGSTWSRLDTGVRGTVYAAAVAPNGDLYATSTVGKSYRLTSGATRFTLDSLKAGGAPRLTDIGFDKNGFGLMSTYDNYVLRTVDSGKTWSKASITTATTLSLGVTVWGSTGIACAANGLVYQTINKGSSWTFQTTQNTQPLYDVDMSGTNAITVGENGTVLYSTNSGSSWTKPTSSGTNSRLNKVRFATSTNAVAISSTGVIIRTVDKGITWATVTSGVTTPLNDIQFHDDKNGIITGDGGVILKTNNGGTSWIKEESHTPYDLKGAIIIDGNTAYIAGSKATILYSSNSALPVELISFSGHRTSLTSALLNWTVANEHDNFGYQIERSYGDTWKQCGFSKGAGTTSTVRSYSLSDAAASNDVLYYRLRQINLDGSEHIIGAISIARSDSQENPSVSIYPNPAISSAKLEFELRTVETVRISVINSLGIEMKIISEETYAVGRHSVEIDTKSFAAGEYRLVLRSPSVEIAKSFIVIK